MPNFRKLTDEEVRAIQNKGKGIRKQIAEEYDALLSDFSAGDMGDVELGEDEVRTTVMSRIKAAAKRKTLLAKFIRTSGDGLRFRVEDSPPASPKRRGRPRKEQPVSTPSKPKKQRGRPKKDT